MINIGTALQDVADICESAGISAAVDARNLNLPGAWVTPDVVSFETMAAGEAIMDISIFLIARDNGPVDSLDALGEMLAKLRTVLSVPEAQVMYLGLPNHGAGELPALQITMPFHIS